MNLRNLAKIVIALLALSACALEPRPMATPAPSPHAPTARVLTGPDGSVPTIVPTKTSVSVRMSEPVHFRNIGNGGYRTFFIVLDTVGNITVADSAMEVNPERAATIEMVPLDTNLWAVKDETGDLFRFKRIAEDAFEVFAVEGSWKLE